MPQLARLFVTVHGYVQGVGFRYFVLYRARALGLRGYVRNRRDGTSVEVCAEGEKAKLEELLELLRQGPAGATVQRVDFHWSEPRGDFTGFEIRF